MIYNTLKEALVARAKLWDPEGKLNGMFFGLEYGGEIAEAGIALNVVKKIEREKLGLPGSRASLQDLGDELSDGVMCAYNLAMAYGIDLDKAIAHKFNKSSVKVGLDCFIAEEVITGNSTDGYSLSMRTK